MTSSSSRYSLRSNGGGYALRSKGASPPPIQCPKSHNSRSAENKVSRLQKKPKQVGEYNPSLSAGKDPLDNVPRLQDCLNPTEPIDEQKPKENLNDNPFLGSKSGERRSHKFATAALSYLREQGLDYKLEKLDLYQGGIISGGARFHHNFMAKPANDPSAPMETFFAQLRYFFKDGRSCHLDDLTVECCVSLGKSECLPYKRDNRGCEYCSKCIRHSKDGCVANWGN